MNISIRNITNKIKNSDDGKRLAENFLSLTLLQICGYVFPILTFPYLTRVLGVELFGAISFATAIIWYFQTVVDWGFFLISTREIAQNRDNFNVVCRILSRTLYSKLILMGISMAILSILTLTIPIFKEKILLLWLTFLLIPGHIFFPEWFFQGLERMKYMTILNFIIKLIFTILVFIFIRSSDDYLFQPILSALGFFIAGLISMYIIIFRWKYRLVRVPLYECWLAIKESSDVFINTLMPNLYNSFSVLLLGFWGGNIANGILEGGAKFVTISCNFLSVISRTFFPFLARRKDKHYLFARINLVCALSISIFLFLLSPQIVHLFLTNEFDSSIIVLRILSFSVFFVSLSTTYGANYLIIHHQERFCRNITATASIIAFICSWILIYYYEWLGAALAMLVGRTLLGGGLYLGAKIFAHKQSI